MLGCVRAGGEVRAPDGRNIAQRGKHNEQRNTEHSTQRATQHSTQRATEHDTQHTTEHSTQRTTEDSTQPTTQRASQHSTQRVTEHDTQRTTEDSTQRTTQRASQHSTQHTTEHSTQRNSEHCTKRTTQRASQHSTQRATEHSKQRITQHATHCTADYGTQRTTLQGTQQATRHARLTHRTVDWWIVLLLVLLCIRSSRSGVSLGAHLVCARVSGLTDKQRAMCRSTPAAIAAVGDGLRMAYAECRQQLSGHRWNCSGVGDGNDFVHVMPLATREAAFTYAITAAGVTHALSAACARGDLPACGCNSNRRRTSPEQFQWGGCGEAAYGVRFARRFLDARELDADARSLMNLHNNRVGRKMVKDLVRRECKCHGVSGSCAMRTCWRALPQYKAVAGALRDKYRRAKMVAPLPPHSHLVIRRSKQTMAVGRQPRKSELVYLEQSPSYCEPDPVSGSLGTHGRTCNRTSRGEDGCETLCCGRGYNTVRAVKTTQCRCRFHWCCRVSCDTCTVRTETHVCK